jgi:hypothetical protein
LAADTHLVLGQVTSDFSSRIAGPGNVEFGERDSQGRALLSANADLRGDLDVGGTFRVIAGEATLWQPLVRVAPVDIRGTLRLLATSQLGSVNLNAGTLVLNSDSEIGTLETGGDLNVAAHTRVTGEARLRRATFDGPGVLEFSGLTTVSNGTQAASVSIGELTVRNTGKWLQAAGSSGGSSISRNFISGLGVFENLGEFEQTTARPLIVQVPIRNGGRMAFAATTVTFDGTESSRRFGKYLPQPGGELALNNTTLDHTSAGTLDLTAGLLRGTGAIWTTGINGGKIINRARLQAGNPTGVLQLNAETGFEQTATGELIVTLANVGGSQLSLRGREAILGGALKVELAEGFTPILGQTFDVLIDILGRTGEFDQVILPDLGSGLKLVVSYSASKVTLTVEAA